MAFGEQIVKTYEQYEKYDFRRKILKIIDLDESW